MRHRFYLTRPAARAVLPAIVLSIALTGSPAQDAAPASGAAAIPAPAVSPRERLLMDFGWRFHLGDAPDAASKFDYPEPTRLDKTIPKEIGLAAKLTADLPDPVAANLGGDVSFVQPSCNDSDWQKLNLPHDWALSLQVDQTADVEHGYKPIGPNHPENDIGWYRRTFSLPVADKDDAFWLEFDGVYRNSLVWLNGHCLGRHPSGYSSFYFDIGKYANFGGTNTLVVRVDATRFEGWFYEGAGIYRHVWLEKTSPVHVAHDGVFVYSQFNDNVPIGPAAIHAQAQLDPAPGGTSPSVDFQVLDPDGKLVAQAQAAPGTDAASPVQAVMTLATPQLWSPATPKLYTLLTTVTNGGETVDQVRTSFGIRTVAFDANKGFILNGKP